LNGQTLYSIFFLKIEFPAAGELKDLEHSSEILKALPLFGLWHFWMKKTSITTTKFGGKFLLFCYFSVETHVFFIKSLENRKI
jgi:hypothetical protein